MLVTPLESESVEGGFDDEAEVLTPFKDPPLFNLSAQIRAHIHLLSHWSQRAVVEQTIWSVLNFDSSLVCLMASCF